MSPIGEAAREKLQHGRPVVLDLTHAFAIVQFRARKLNMVTAPIGAGGLTRRYAVPIQQRGLAVGGDDRSGESWYSREGGAGNR